MDRLPRRATDATDPLNRPRPARRLSRGARAMMPAARANMPDDVKWHARASHAPSSARRPDLHSDGEPPPTCPSTCAPPAAHRALDCRPADTAVDPAAMSLGARNQSVRRVRARSASPRPSPEPGRTGLRSRASPSTIRSAVRPSSDGRASHPRRNTHAARELAPPIRRAQEDGTLVPCLAVDRSVFGSSFIGRLSLPSRYAPEHASARACPMPLTLSMY